MKNLFRAVATAVFLASGGAMAHDVPACVVDNAKKDPSFVAYRAKLQKAIKARDVNTLVAASAPNIKLSFGGDEGRQTFSKMLGESKQGKGPTGVDPWSELEFILDNGGLLDEDQGYAAPSYYAVNPPAGLKEGFEMYVTGSMVLVRKQPNSNAEVLDRVSCDYIKPLDTDWDAKWRKIETRGGTVGYMAGRFLRHNFDYRAGFSKKSGKWQMTFFIAGD